MTRREEREYIFKTIFRNDFSEDVDMNEQVDLFMMDVISDMGYTVEAEEADFESESDYAGMSGKKTGRKKKNKEEDEEKIPDIEFIEKICAVHKDIEFVRNTAKDIVGKVNELDDIIRQYCAGWTPEHMGKAELSILRLAIYEIKYRDDVPYGIAINEAVNLAKAYGDDKAPSFINGVLAKVPENI